MTLRQSLLLTGTLLLLAPLAAQAVPRTILMERYSNGW